MADKKRCNRCNRLFPAKKLACARKGCGCREYRIERDTKK